MSQTIPIKTDLSALNEEQRKAVTSELRQILVLAGADWDRGHKDANQAKGYLKRN